MNVENAPSPLRDPPDDDHHDVEETSETAKLKEKRKVKAVAE